jgi:hypothetical protein
VAVEDRVEERTDAPSSLDRNASLSAYVDLPIADVVARFADSAIDDLLTSAIRTALGLDADGELWAHAETCLWVSSGNARVAVTWSAQAQDGQVNEGTATISLLVVQSGYDAITELLVSLPVNSDTATLATEAAHRILDEVTRRLER